MTGPNWHGAATREVTQGDVGVPPVPNWDGTVIYRATHGNVGSHQCQTGPNWDGTVTYGVTWGSHQCQTGMGLSLLG